MMNGSFRAETLKIRKRAATWVLGALTVAIVVFWSYVVGYIVCNDVLGDSARAADLELVRETLMVKNFHVAGLDTLARFGGAVALVFGAVVAGSEFIWNTIKTVFMQRPVRNTVLAGEIAATGASIAAFVLASFVAAPAAAIALSGPVGAAVTMPSVPGVLLGFGAAWLVLMAWAASGLALASVTRSIAAAVGLGLVYFLAIENAVSGLADRYSILEALKSVFIGPNARALAEQFIPESLVQNPPSSGPAQAVAALCGAVAVAAVVSALAWRRDVN
ncbi:MAG: hypothetical protein FJ319_14080 [SAR202 cluster bacterium]|nr:hypothetical protein [SAR202 cluster bacterium]